MTRITHEGGMDLRWEDGGKTLAWSFADKFYRIGLDDVLALTTPSTDSLPQPEVIAIDLSVPRHYPKGVVALRGGRAVTMRGEEVIENATIVVTDNRITAVGHSSEVTPLG